MKQLTRRMPPIWWPVATGMLVLGHHLELFRLWTVFVADSQPATEHPGKPNLRQGLPQRTTTPILVL